MDVCLSVMQGYQSSTQPITGPREREFTIYLKSVLYDLCPMCFILEMLVGGGTLEIFKINVKHNYYSDGSIFTQAAATMVAC